MKYSSTQLYSHETDLILKFYFFIFFLLDLVSAIVIILNIPDKKSTTLIPPSPPLISPNLGPDRARKSKR